MCRPAQLLWETRRRCCGSSMKAWREELSETDLTVNEIRFLDLITPHAELEEELVTVFRQALRSASFVGGPMVEDFEAAFAEFCGVDYCVGASSGTDALRFALMAAGVGQGDVVVTVP